VKVEQKYVNVSIGRMNRSRWLLGDRGDPTYLASQGGGHSGIEKDLKDGWIIKYCWEDGEQIVFILERIKL
jgi:hypothetical protein